MATDAGLSHRDRAGIDGIRQIEHAEEVRLGGYRLVVGLNDKKQGDEAWIAAELWRRALTGVDWVNWMAMNLEERSRNWLNRRMFIEGNGH